MTKERRTTTLRLTPAQLLWLKQESVNQRRSAQDIIEAALIVAGAPKGSK